MKAKIQKIWENFKEKHPTFSQLLVFFVVSNGITLLQLVIMPLFKQLFDQTSLINTNFQVGQIGTAVGGSPFYIFNYAAGSLASGGGGGLAYFLAIQITLAIAQIINFFVQRKVTFKSNGSVGKAIFWYIIAYVIITIGAAALQGFYKVPVYNFFMNTLAMGSTGEVIADVITMIINSAISFWVFFPIFKVIFKDPSPTEKVKV